MRVVSFDAATDTTTMTSHFPFTFESLQTSVDADSNVLLRDNAHGLFRLWFILVDGEIPNGGHTASIKLIHDVNVTFTEGYVNVTCNRFLLTKTGIFKSDYCAKEF